ncbi:uncharacterized protein [Primulina eburnea]|uniref:uncharacterized protein n=1 Tax=Primulina eburnea TaxID=1245227 RepID=UPI003C6C2080
MKLFGRFRKIIMRFIFPVHSRSGSPAAASGAAVAVAVPRRSSCDSRTSCSNSLSNLYSSDSHYNEAIADCIEFFNKSSYDMV